MAEPVAILAGSGHQQLLRHHLPQRTLQLLIVQTSHGGQQPMRHLPAGHRRHPQHLLWLVGQAVNPALQQVAAGGGQCIRAGPHRRQQLLGEERVAFRAGEHRLDQVGRWGGVQDRCQLGDGCGPVQAGQLQALDPAATVQLGQVRTQPIRGWLVAAVGHHQQQPLEAQVADQEAEQLAGRLVGPVQVLHDQQQRRLLTEPPQQAQQQLKQPRLRGLAGRAARRLAEAGEQTGKLRPRRPDQFAHRAHPELGGQGPQCLHDRGIRQPVAAGGQAAAHQHPRPGRAAAVC